MVTREELQKIKARDLQHMAVARGIKGVWDMKKAEVIEAILRAETAEDSKEITSAIDKVKTDNDTSDGVEVEKEKSKGSANADTDQKMSYIEGAKVGTLVAFKLPNGKVKSAKVVKRSTKNRRFQLETDYGAQYIASFDDVVWVRTGNRWPKGVYKLLKGMVDDGERIG